jgi:hypothetical protein
MRTAFKQATKGDENIANYAKNGSVLFGKS